MRLSSLHFNQLMTNSYSILTAASYSRLSLLIIHKINHSITDSGGGIQYVDTKDNGAILIACFFIYSYISGIAMVNYFSKRLEHKAEIFGVSMHFMIHISGEICAFALKDLLLFLLSAYVYNRLNEICYLYMSLWTALLILTGILVIKGSSYLCGVVGVEAGRGDAIVQFNSTSFGFATALAMATILLSAMNFQLESESADYSDDDGEAVIDDESRVYTSGYFLILVWMTTLLICSLISNSCDLDRKESQENREEYEKLVAGNELSLTGSLLASGDLNSSFSIEPISGSIDAASGIASGSRKEEGDLLQQDGYKKMCSVFLGTMSGYYFYLLLASGASDSSSSDTSHAVNILLALIALSTNVYICIRMMNLSAYKKYFDVRTAISTYNDSCLSRASKIWRDITTKNIDFKLQMYRITVAFMIEETLVRVYGAISTESTPNVILAATATLAMLIGFNLLEYYNEKEEKKERESQSPGDHHTDEISSSAIL